MEEMLTAGGKKKKKSKQIAGEGETVLWTSQKTTKQLLSLR